MIKFDERDLKQALMIPKNVTLSKEQYMSRIRELAMKGRDYLKPCPVCILGQAEIDKNSVNKQDCIDAWNSKGML